MGYPLSWEYRIPGVYALLLLPILLTLWARRRALQAEKAAEVDPAVVWFGYSRFLQWLSTGTWILWIGALITFQVHALLSFILDGLMFSKWFGLVIWLQYLPAPVLVFCSALSHPVFTRLRGLDLSRTDLVRQAVWGQARVFAFACFGIALFALSVDARLSMVWIVVGIASLVVVSQARMKALGMTPQALSVGELRDRVFALATGAGVKVQQIYVLPAGKGRTANAFAASGNRVLLTDYLLQHLSKREVDAVVAHELTHLKRRHPRALSFIVLAMFVSANAALAFLSSRAYAEALIALTYIVIIAMGLFLTYFFSRRFEWVADAGAVTLTGDAEACITGLTKLSRLNMMPMQWGKVTGNLLTHPSTLRRVEAIAKQGNLPTERLQELLTSFQELTASPLSLDECYPLPSAHSDTTAFSTQFKNSVLQRLFWSVLIVTALVPALIALWTQWRHLEGGALWAAYALGLAITFFARRKTTEVLSVRSYRQLEQMLRKKFDLENQDQTAGASAAMIPPPRDAFYVGLSPAASPRLYESFYDWDTGFVWFKEDAFLYLGEQTRFQLQREHLLQVETRAHTLDWWNWHRVYITWRTDDKEGTFYVRPGTNGSQHGSRRASQSFVQQLESWRAQQPMPGAESPLGLSLASQEIPQLGEVTSQSPKIVCSAANIFLTLVLQSFATFCVCVLFCLSVQHGQTAGRYALAASILVLLFSLLPICCYREPKVAQP